MIAYSGSGVVHEVGAAFFVKINLSEIVYQAEVGQGDCFFKVKILSSFGPGAGPAANDCSIRTYASTECRDASV